MSQFTLKIKDTLNKEAFEKLRREFEANKNKIVNVGIPEGPTEPGSKGLTLARLGAIHEFGATIEHPGGTSYGRRADGKYRFLKNGEAQFARGKTGAHVITIPERPWLIPAIRENMPKFVALNKVNLLKIMRGEISFDQALGQLGLMGESFAKQKIAVGPFTPLARATIKRKKSSKPLIDTGNMLQSITYSLSEK